MDGVSGAAEAGVPPGPPFNIQAEGVAHPSQGRWAPGPGCCVEARPEAWALLSPLPLAHAPGAPCFLSHLPPAQRLQATTDPSPVACRLLRCAVTPWTPGGGAEL